MNWWERFWHRLGLHQYGHVEGRPLGEDDCKTPECRAYRVHLGYDTLYGFRGKDRGEG